MSTGPWQPGAEVVPREAPRVLRARGDRRGFEPLAVTEPLPPPDRPAGGWRVGDQAGPIWQGQPVERLLVDISQGGLGDAVRQLALVRGAVRCGRVKTPLIACRPGVAHTWLSAAIAPYPAVPVGRVPPGAQAVLPPIHGLPTMAWTTWPTAPLTAMVAHLFKLPIAALAGPCLNLDRRDVAAVDARLGEAGWMGEPLVAVQTDTHPVGPDLTRDLRYEKVPKGLDAAIPHLVRAGCFVIRVGAEAAEGSLGIGYGVIDLGGCSIARMVAALWRADLAVTGDSGPLHLAAAVGTPVAALFGPSDPDIHVCAAGTVPIVPPPTACPVLPCGKRSLLGGPLEADHATRIPLPCPPEGGCLTRMTGDRIARAALAVLGRVGGVVPR